MVITRIAWSVATRHRRPAGATCSAYASASEIAFAKMVGLVVTPLTCWSWIRDARLPLVSRCRERSSSQMETPASASAFKRSFMSEASLSRAQDWTRYSTWCRSGLVSLPGHESESGYKTEPFEGQEQMSRLEIRSPMGELQVITHARPEGVGLPRCLRRHGAWSQWRPIS